MEGSHGGSSSWALSPLPSLRVTKFGQGAPPKRGLAPSSRGEHIPGSGTFSHVSAWRWPRFLPRAIPTAPRSRCPLALQESHPRAAQCPGKGTSSGEASQLVFDPNSLLWRERGESKPVWRAGPPPDSAALLTPSPCSQLNYTRPGLPKLNPRLLENWKNEVKEKGHINCPNNVRNASPLLLSPHGGNFLGQKPSVLFVPEHRGCSSFVAAQPRV